MKINFSQVIKTIKDEPMKVSDDDPRVVDLAWICTNALLAPVPSDKRIDGKEKVTRFALALKIREGGVIDLKVDEVSKLKGLVGELDSPLIVGRAWELLENEESDSNNKKDHSPTEK